MEREVNIPFRIAMHNTCNPVAYFGYMILFDLDNIFGRFVRENVDSIHKDLEPEFLVIYKKLSF